MLRRDRDARRRGEFEPICARTGGCCEAALIAARAGVALAREMGLAGPDSARAGGEGGL